MQVGDYGKLDKQTGEFSREGNIHEDNNIAVLVKDHRSTPAAREDVFIAASTEVIRSDLKLCAEMLVRLQNLSLAQTYTFSEILGLAGASIKGQ